MRKFWSGLVVAAAVFGLGAGGARGDVLFSNLGAGDSYNGSSGLTIDSIHSAAVAFTPSVTESLDTVELGLIWTGAGSGTAGVVLAADNAGNPGAVLESMSVGGVLSGLAVASSSSHPVLDSGTQYWIVVAGSGGENPTEDAWRFNTILNTNPVRSSANGGATWTNPGTVAAALRVNGLAAVPEPTAGMALLLGVLMLSWIRRPV